MSSRRKDSLPFVHNIRYNAPRMARFGIFSLKKSVRYSIIIIIGILRIFRYAERRRSRFGRLGRREK